MARVDVEDRRFDTPKGTRRSVPFRGSGDNDRFGRFTEWFARGMGTPGFLLGLSVFVDRLDGVEHLRARARCGSTRSRSASRC